MRVMNYDEFIEDVSAEPLLYNQWMGDEYEENVEDADRIYRAVEDLVYEKAVNDPDYIHMSQERIAFFDWFDHRHVRYIVYFGVELSDEKREHVENLLKEFYADSFQEFFELVEDASWDAFNSMDSDAIAFRGGTGMVYAIWRRNDK